MNEDSLAPPGAWERLRRNRVATVATLILGLVVGFALFGPAVFGTDPHSTTGEQFQPPSTRHLFGTDVNGRDVLARVIEGARI
jgi:ABC-type dipeptide/oligopeptide/nickel transport system permease subunit